jgi:gamma-glutamyltranspeptidase / glutathione hydrolase
MLRSRSLALSLLIVPGMLMSQQQQRVPTVAGKSVVYAPNAVAATSQPLATSTALAVMQRGGNAIDAAVAAAAVLGVVEPMMVGIGGDMFAIVWSAKEKKLIGLNASGRAGSKMTREELLKRAARAPQRGNGGNAAPRIPRGPESVTVPSGVAGWDMLLKKYGTMTLAQTLQPAIEYAENGFVVTPVIANDWSAAKNLLGRDAGAKKSLLLPNGEAPKAGEFFRNPDLAASMRMIAKDGPATLYGGALGKKIVDHLDEIGGFLTLDDMKKNQPNWVTPISTTFKGYRIWELPPNNQGIATLEMLRILDTYDLKAMGHNSAPYLHHLIEAKKLAYADLAQYVGDADHLKLTPAQMLSDPFINQRRSQLDSKQAKTQVQPGPERIQSETIYLTVADKEGNMVSFINSNFDEFGSGIVVPGTGFVLHDRGLGFTLTEGLPNTVAPGKRPFHTLIPGFITKPGVANAADGAGDEPYMSFGLMGGAMQAQGHAQFIINHLVFGMDIQAAQDAGRFRHESGLRLIVESVIPQSVMDQLKAMGHEVSVSGPGQFGGSQAIIKLSKGYAAGSDPRKDGHAAGY